MKIFLCIIMQNSNQIFEIVTTFHFVVVFSNTEYSLPAKKKIIEVRWKLYLYVTSNTKNNVYKSCKSGSLNPLINFLEMGHSKISKTEIRRNSMYEVSQSGTFVKCVGVREATTIWNFSFSRDALQFNILIIFKYYYYYFYQYLHLHYYCYH